MSPRWPHFKGGTTLAAMIYQTYGAQQHTRLPKNKPQLSRTCGVGITLLKRNLKLMMGMEFTNLRPYPTLLFKRSLTYGSTFHSQSLPPLRRHALPTGSPPAPLASWPFIEHHPEALKFRKLCVSLRKGRPTYDRAKRKSNSSLGHNPIPCWCNLRI